MAIHDKDTSTEGHSERQLIIDNGDLQGLNDVLSTYGFVSYEALLRYALVALLQTEDNRLYIKKNGEITRLNPSDKLFRPTNNDGSDKSGTT